MEKTEIPIIDRVLEIFPWDNSKEYKKIENRYGEGIKTILEELLLFPILYFDSINDLSESIGRDKNKYYDLFKDPEIDWLLLLQEITWNLFITVLQVYQANEDESFRSRWRIRILMDDTLIRRWSLKMAGVYNTYNHIDKHYMYAQKVVFLAISVGDGKFVFPLVYAFTKKKTHPDYQKTTEIVIDVLDDLYDFVKEHDLTFQGVRIVGDSGYTSKEIVLAAKSMGLEFYGSLSASWNFILEDGRIINVGNLKNGLIPARPRQSSSFKDEYYRLLAYHPILGKVVLCITPYIEAGTHKIKYWVYVCSNPDIGCNLVAQEHTIRWKIEQMFKTFKHNLGIRFYQGISTTGQHAWFALTCLRFIFVQIAFKISSRFPSLRWNIKKKKFGLAKMMRYIRNNYHLSHKSNSNDNKRLHYTLMRKAS